MFSARIFSFATLGVIAVATFTSCSSIQPRQQALFDGKTLNGWTQRGGKASYAVEDGCIVGTTSGDSANSFLCSSNTFRDFVLELEVKSATNLNSGIQIRSHCYDHRTTFVWDGKTNTIPAGRVHGYQIEVDNRPERRWSGGLYEEAQRGWLQDVTNRPAAQAAFKFGEWNKYRIECVGNRIRSWVNGVPVTDFVDNDGAREGFIALQVHGTREAGLRVRFRKIYLREISRKPSTRTEMPTTESASKRKSDRRADGAFGAPIVTTQHL